MEVIKKKVKSTKKETYLKILASILKWITRGSIDKNSVIAIGGLMLAASNMIGPTSLRPELEAANKAVTVLQTQAMSIPFYEVDTFITGTDTTYVISLN